MLLCSLQVPVGGTIIAAFEQDIIDKISKSYPGRASASQSIDVLITLLAMGSEKYKSLIRDRKDCFIYLKDELQNLAERNNEKVFYFKV